MGLLGGTGIDPALVRSNLRIARLAAHGLGLHFVTLRRGRRRCVATYLETHAMRRPRASALLTANARYDYEEFNARANQVAHGLAALGAVPGDVVALLMESRPEYLFTFMGANKLGVVVALVNAHIVGEALAHALRLAAPKWIVVDDAHADALAALSEPPVANDRILRWPVAAFDGSPRANPPSTMRRTVDETAAYIYTSGTTGLPKAARLSNQRMLRSMHVFADIVGETTKDDVVYSAGLPFYHSSGTMVAFGMALLPGAALAMREKFSATEFWDDVHRQGATVFVYVGELCRYLANRPPDPRERGHRLRRATGAGLRAELWPTMIARFGIRSVREFYGATEGNVGLINLDERPGMLGRRMPGQVIVRAEPGTATPLRGTNGKPVLAEEGEDGLLLGPISAVNSFDGYVDRGRNREKVLVDPFGDGRSYFNTGDLVRLWPHGYLSFADRVGDTFRWKGENVSTTEVAGVVGSAPGVLEANVYGVEVPGHDGRAGMAAIVAAPDFVPSEVAAHVVAALPRYARPLVLRVVPAMPTTASLKHVKTGLQTEGFDPDRIADPMYLLVEEDYLPLDEALYQSLVRGAFRP